MSTGVCIIDSGAGKNTRQRGLCVGVTAEVRFRAATLFAKEGFGEKFLRLFIIFLLAQNP